MLKTLFLTIFPGIFCPAGKQSFSPIKGFGEGIVHINVFTFPPGEPVGKIYSSLDTARITFKYRYYIKNDHIRSIDSLISDTAMMKAGASGNERPPASLTLTAAYYRPSYLIYWSEQISYRFFTAGNGQQEVEQKDLKEESFDLFYRLLLPDSHHTVISRLAASGPVIIAGKKCYEGRATTKTGESFSFYYTADSCSVRSPLNGLLGANLPYNVMAAGLQTNWTLPGNKKATGNIVFQVSSIEECKLPDSLVTLPAGIPVRKNIPIQELYFFHYRQQNH